MKKKTQSYKDLIVWRKSIDLAKVVYGLTAKFPAEEKFGIIAQRRRASISIPSNVVELKFCENAAAAPAFHLADKVRRMFNSLRRQLIERL